MGTNAARGGPWAVSLLRRWATPLVLAVATGALSAAAAWGLSALDAPPAPLPGTSFDGPARALSLEERALREQLREDVRALVVLGERSTRRPASLLAAERGLSERLTAMRFTPERQTYRADGVECANVIVDVGREAGHQLLIGAHYDSAAGSPGANDNASGVAVLLALARSLSERAPDRWVRLVFFVNEEPPHFRSPSMGSHVYAREAEVAGLLPARVVVLDSVGFYSSAPRSQRFPTARLLQRFGDRGDFVALVAEEASEPFLFELGAAFRAHAELPSRGGAFPAQLAGVAWSDHASFWRYGVPSVLVSDTAAFRDPAYHRHTDRGAQIDYDSLTRLTVGLDAALRALTPAEAQR